MGRESLITDLRVRLLNSNGIEIVPDFWNALLSDPIRGYAILEASFSSNGWWDGLADPTRAGVSLKI